MKKKSFLGLLTAMMICSSLTISCGDAGSKEDEENKKKDVDNAKVYSVMFPSGSSEITLSGKYNEATDFVIVGEGTTYEEGKTEPIPGVDLQFTTKTPEPCATIKPTEFTTTDGFSKYTIVRNPDDIKGCTITYNIDAVKKPEGISRVEPSQLTVKVEPTEKAVDHNTPPSQPTEGDLNINVNAEGKNGFYKVYYRFVADSCANIVKEENSTWPDKLPGGKNFATINPDTVTITSIQQIPTYTIPKDQLPEITRKVSRGAVVVLGLAGETLDKYVQAGCLDLNPVQAGTETVTLHDIFKKQLDPSILPDLNTIKGPYELHTFINMLSALPCNVDPKNPDTCVKTNNPKEFKAYEWTNLILNLFTTPGTEITTAAGLLIQWIVDSTKVQIPGGNDLSKNPYYTSAKPIIDGFIRKEIDDLKEKLDTNNADKVESVLSVISDLKNLVTDAQFIGKLTIDNIDESNGSANGTHSYTGIKYKLSSTFIPCYASTNKTEKGCCLDGQNKPKDGFCFYDLNGSSNKANTEHREDYFSGKWQGLLKTQGEPVTPTLTMYTHNIQNLYYTRIVFGIIVYNIIPAILRSQNSEIKLDTFEEIVQAALAAPFVNFYNKKHKDDKLTGDKYNCDGISQVLKDSVTGSESALAQILPQILSQATCTGAITVLKSKLEDYINTPKVDLGELVSFTSKDCKITDYDSKTKLGKEPKDERCNWDIRVNLNELKHFNDKNSATHDVDPNSIKLNLIKNVRGTYYGIHQ